MATINTRTFELSNNVYKNNKFSKNKNFGEITNSYYNSNDVDFRMPMRSEYNCKKEEIDYDKTSYRSFDIYNDEKEASLNVEYYDPNSDKIFDMENETESVIKKANPTEYVSYSINDYNWFLYENLRNLTTSNTFISTLGIYQHLSVIYIGSKGQTNTNIKKYLNLFDARSFYDGIRNVTDILNKSQCCDYKNIFLIRNDIMTNKSYVDYIKFMETVIPIDPQQCDSESNKINNFIEKTYGKIITNTVNKNHIYNMNTLLLSVGIIRTVWETPFEKIIKLRFNNKLRDYMYNIGKAYNYFEDPTMQLIELNMFDNVLSMGIILPKSNNLPKIEMKEFNIYMTSMKMTILDEVIIPTFTHKSKMRTSSILKKTGMETLFINYDISELTTSPLMISDIVQNMVVIVDNKSFGVDNKFNVRGVNSRRKFIANKPFVYYFKILGTNTVILTGMFTE